MMSVMFSLYLSVVVVVVVVVLGFSHHHVTFILICIKIIILKSSNGSISGNDSYNSTRVTIIVLPNEHYWRLNNLLVWSSKKISPFWSILQVKCFFRLMFFTKFEIRLSLDKYTSVLISLIKSPSSPLSCGLPRYMTFVKKQLIHPVLSDI